MDKIYTAGKFTITIKATGASSISSPDDGYPLAERLEAVAAGEVARYGMTHAGLEPMQALVVALQTDYAAWKGLQPFRAQVAS